MTVVVLGLRSCRVVGVRSGCWRGGGSLGSAVVQCRAQRWTIPGGDGQATEQLSTPTQTTHRSRAQAQILKPDQALVLALALAQFLG